ncbi:MAG: thiazole biosynthesis protein ThiJ [Candidatus Hydrogenedentota bacterium]
MNAIPRLIAVVGMCAISLAAGAQATKTVDAPAVPVTIGVLLYPGFEVLDVFGPVEMFLNLGSSRVRVVMIAEQAGEIKAAPSAGHAGEWAGPKVIAEYGFADAPPMDILMVPGGMGTLQQLNNEACLQFLREQSEKAKYVTSVCSGSALLAKAGVLDGRKATCNKQYYGMLIGNGPNVDWQPKARWVEDGKFITSSGVSAGMDMALAVIAKLFGEEAAQSIAKGTEYVWNSDPANDPFAKEVNPKP